MGKALCVWANIPASLRRIGRPPPTAVGTAGDLLISAQAITLSFLADSR
jgi:hypothetical protein